MRTVIVGLVSLAAALGAAAQPPRARDLFGDPLPEGAVLRLGTERLRAPITSFGILADGTVVTVGPGNAVRTWGPKDDESDVPIPIPLAGPKSQWIEPQVSPDGRFIAAQSRVKVVVWERPVDRIKEVASFDIDKPRYLLFSPDVSKLAVINETERANRMSLCDIKTGKVNELAGEPQYFETMTFSGDGKVLVGTSGYEAFVWDTVTGEKRAQYKTGKTRYSDIAMNTKGDVMAVTPTWGDKVVFVDPMTGKPIDGLIGPPSGYPLSFAADGKTLLVGSKAGVTWWDPLAGQLLRKFEGMAHSGYGGPHPAPRLTPDGKTLVATSGEVLLRWDAATGQSRFPLAQDGGHQYQVWAVGASPDGKWYATGGHDNTVRIWDAATGKTVKTFPSRFMNERTVEFSADSKYIFCPSEDHTTVVKWDVATGEVAHRFEYQKETPKRGSLVAFGLTADGKTVLAASQGEKRDGGLVAGWDAATGAVRFQKEMTDSPAFMFPIGSFSPDGKVFGSDFGLIALDDPKKTLLPDRKARSFDRGTFTADGKLVAFTEEETKGEMREWRVAVYNIETGKLAVAFPVESSVSLGFSPDGKTIAVAGAKGLAFHDAATGQEFARWKAPFGNRNGESLPFARTVRFTRDSRRAITAHDDTAPLIWIVPAREAPSGFAITPGA